MSEREYIVSLNRGVDHVAFNQEMIASTGAGAIPSRSATVTDERATNVRNTHYDLTDAEAEALKADPRVFGVTLLPELDSSIGIGHDALQTGDFTKTTLDRGDYLNWGMRRMNEATNPYTGVSAAAGGYGYTLDGTGVDVVIVDSGIQADHPEFQDAAGVSRVQQIDWFTESGVSGTMPTAHYTDYDGHGTHVAGTAAGKTYGWAKNAKIYAVKLAGLEGSTDPNVGISPASMADVIIGWHNAKPVDPDTGYKRPTVVNHSGGYARYYNTVTSLTYQGVSKTGTDIDSTSKRWAFGLVPISGGSAATYVTNLRLTSIDTDVQLMIDAGIHICVAAGNRYHKIDVLGGDDFSNFIVADTGSVEYQKGSSPSDDEAHIVGNIDSTVHASGLEQKAVSSETGPGVSIYAPGTDIMSAMSTNNRFSATTLNNPYPSNAAFLINNISGTSMASPQVSGMLALWLQINPGATPAQAKTFIESTAKTAKIHDTASVVDYTDSRSLLGSTNRFGFNKFNSNVQMRIGAPVEEAAAAAAATYSLSTSSAAVNEGSTFTITLTTTNIADNTVIPYTITGVTSADLSSASLTGNFTISSNSATVTFTVASDATTEGGETFLLSLDALSVTQSVTINDTSLTPAGTPTYAVAPAANNVDEGSALVFNVTTANVADATTLYWTVTNTGDFSTSSGSFAITSNAGTFSVTPTADTTTEGAETFTASVRTASASGSIVATSSTVTINDTSLAPTFTARTVTVASGTNSYGTGNKYYIAEVAGVSPTLLLTEGTTYRFDQSDASNATHQLLFSTTANGTWGGGVEYTTGVTKVGTAGTAGAYTEIAVAASAPGLHYYCVNHTGMGGIANTGTPTYGVVPTANNVDEGSALTFNITTTNVTDATTLYWTATSAADFSTSSGSFTITSNAGSVAVTPTADTTTEGAETFTLQIRTVSVGGSVVATSSAVTINDTSTSGASYALAASQSTVTEGESTTITLTTANVADATNVPYTISGVSQADLDEGPLTSTAIKDYEGPGGALFARELTTNYLRIVAAGAVGGQTAVPDDWLLKTGRMAQLFLNRTGSNIVTADQDQVRANLKGATTSWHPNSQAIQRVARGGGASYTPSFLTDDGSSAWGLYQLYTNHSADDMVWYLNSSSGRPQVGDDDAGEVMEHILHTLCMKGLDNPSMKFDADAEAGWATGPTFLAIQQAVNGSKFDPSGYAANWSTQADHFTVAAKEYLYLLTFGMFEYTSLWDGGSLSPEWTDDMRTPAGIQTNNALGYALFNTYMKPVFDNPTLATIRAIFQNGDNGDPTLAGANGYVTSTAISLTGNFTVASNTSAVTLNVAADGVTDVDSLSLALDNAAASQAITVQDNGVTPGFNPDYALYVTNSGSSSYTVVGRDRNGAISGSQSALAFNNGDKVLVTVNSATSSGHPFYIKTAQSTGTGSQASGVTGNGTQNIEWTIGSTGTFYYICQFHAGMYNTITVS